MPDVLLFLLLLFWALISPRVNVDCIGYFPLINMLIINFIKKKGIIGPFTLLDADLILMIEEKILFRGPWESFDCLITVIKIGQRPAIPKVSPLPCDGHYPSGVFLSTLSP